MQGDRRGFTLIELLVVIAITMLLISVLAPSVARVRKHAKQVKCAAHIRQLGVGMTMYLDEYNCFPAHQWRLADGSRIRWFNAMAHLLASYDVQGCPSVPDWEVGRNNSYGYNYKYLGSVRDNDEGPSPPYECFPVKDLRSFGRTIAFACSDGTGWTVSYTKGVKDVGMLGNHGYTLDPTYIPTYSLSTYSGGDVYPYASKEYRSYISDRHIGGANACFADGHAEKVIPEDVYQDNTFWNGLGFEDPELDPHVEYRSTTRDFRYELED